MTETEKIIDTIGKLPEIEFAEVLGGIAEQIRRNNWNHLVDDYFNIDDHSEELEDAEHKLEKLKGEKDALREAIQDAIDKLNAVS